MSNDDIIELTALCADLMDGRITSAGQARLNAVLKGSGEARQFYVRHAALSASLFSYAAEMQSDPAVALVRKPKIIWWTGAMAAVAAVVLLFIRWMPQDYPTTPGETKLAAVVTGVRDCVWAGAPVALGSPLHAGQRLELAGGVAEVTFDSGAQVTLEGPAAFVVGSAWEASLERGSVKAKVPEEAIGFRISHPSVEVVDLGTEFSILADAGGAEVLVLKGSVEAFASGEASPLLLKEQESRRFAKDGISEVRDRERKFAHFAQVFKLDRAAVSDDYAHWSFDESEGTVLLAEPKSKKKRGGRPKLDANANATLTEGRWGKGLEFNGHLVAKAAVPEVSGAGAARTIAFWVRIPEAPSLKDSNGSILGWGQRSRKHGAQSARIAWNQSPAEGPVGAIRSELGRVSLMGSTNVRDGRWHHIAVVLVPDAAGLLHVKQYVDGRLDGSPADERPGKRSFDPRMNDAIDTLWLGCSPQDRAKETFFSGALDELFLIERALSPAEIVGLMHRNQLDAELAASF